jgi:hypothetical protein
MHTLLTRRSDAPQSELYITSLLFSFFPVAENYERRIFFTLAKFLMGDINLDFAGMKITCESINISQALLSVTITFTLVKSKCSNSPPKK